MISKFKIFESRIDIDAICARCDITNYTINDDMSISVDGDVDLAEMELDRGELGIDKIPLKFKEVTGDFICFSNNLESLKGCPQNVGGDFHCFNSKLESLEFCPQNVGGDFNCSYNKLKSLEFCPQSVGGGFYCHHSKLESLEFCPQNVGGDFRCHNNHLKSLEFCPKEVSGDFTCSDNSLESLEFCPERVGGSFICSNNKLKSLEFGPKEINSDFNFDCSYNNITNFDGLPEFFESNIYIPGNPVYEIYKLFNNTHPNPKCIYYIREFDVIQGNRVIKDRLEEVYVHMGMKMPKNIKFEEYILV